ncbi:hypothetical protein [Nitrospina watsonii]|uniref:Eukaryotic translation initiation factor 3 30 kDa subunit n=1 Tax=Nitrospina watsonii TaxID=1323948 RepID=A0ABM9HFN1_9BACT|nr:hypothetical protein [Nitrospina watsonii]CAI2719042.1 Eukaryotic translation initiation factor 3 30 kDa subunit [Nitrospina watsonii]
MALDIKETPKKDFSDYHWSREALEFWDWIEDVLAQLIREKAKKRAQEKLRIENSDLVTEDDMHKFIPEILEKLKSEINLKISQK